MMQILIGLAVLALLSSESSSSSDRKKARLSPPEDKPKLPALFEPVSVPERILEVTSVVHEGGKSYAAKYYQPPFRPAPWTVRAWYDEDCGAHTIDITPHPVLSDDDFTVKVRVGGMHNADRNRFRHSASLLWPDDKYANRVLYRAPAGRSVCFLIDISVADHRFDFFHEPLVGRSAVLIAEDEPRAADQLDRFAQLREIEAVETQYAAARAKLEQRADLSADVKHQLESHLLVMREEQLRKILRGE